MTRMNARLSITILLCLPFLSQLSLASELDMSLADFDVIKTLHADLTGDGQDEAILVARKKLAKNEQPTLLIVDKGKILVESPLALLPVDNAHSPASFDGFEIAIITSHPETTSVIDIQSETTEVIHPSVPGKQLVLRTVEEGNSHYNFNLQFAYDATSNGVALRSVFLNTNNTSCDQSLKNVYAVHETSLLAKPLRDFNGREAFQELKTLYQGLQAGNGQSIKLMPQEISRNFDQALAAYKAKDKQHFKQSMDTFIDGSDSNEACPADSYIADKYYFPNNPRWSNDLGFLFEQVGYFSEAIELLNEVTTQQPKRAVAYLNLADSYWAADNADQATVMYEKYQSLMKEQGRSNKVPKRVIERINARLGL
jgi:hypothetical protein